MQTDEFFDGTIGGGELPASATRSELTVPQGMVAHSVIDKQLVRLLTLHPDLRLQFRNNNLATMDDGAKRQLLEDMRDILGITSPNYEESLR